MAAWALNESFAAADEARYQQYDAVLEQRIRQARIDSPYNPSLAMPGNHWGDSMAYYRGMGGRVPAYYPSYGGDKNIMRNPYGAQVFSGDYGRNMLNAPYPRPYSTRQFVQQHSPFVYNADEQTATYAGVPSSAGVPGVRDAGESIRNQQEFVDQNLNVLAEELAEAMRELGVPKLSKPQIEVSQQHVNPFRRFWDWFTDERVTEDELRAFENRFGPLLRSYQESVLWNWQAANRTWRNFVDRWRMAPREGPFIRRYLVPAGENAQLRSVSVVP